MATIDTSGIDALYPIAGVDNDSQGFRDNFAAIKTALESAVGLDVAQTLTNKTLTSPTITNPTVSGSLNIDTAGNIVFEGATADSYETTLTAADPTQDRTITLPDATGTVALLADATSGALGYVTGKGGAVTQATSKSTGVTLNKACGTITLNNSALADDTVASFTLTNSVIAATDVVLASIKSGATAGAYTVVVDEVSAGSCRFSLKNVSGASLSEALLVNFIVIKSVAA